MSANKSTYRVLAIVLPIMGLYLIGRFPLFFVILYFLSAAAFGYSFRTNKLVSSFKGIHQISTELQIAFFAGIYLIFSALSNIFLGKISFYFLVSYALIFVPIVVVLIRLLSKSSVNLSVAATLIMSVASAFWYFKSTPENNYLPGVLFGISVVGLLGALVQSKNTKEAHERKIKNFGNTHGTAKFAKNTDLEHLTKSKQGLYIGGNFYFGEQGNVLTVAGARSGKGTNLIIPNLLGVSDHEGSWVVIDPKGELAAITATYQTNTDRKVIILDPFRTLKKQAKIAPKFNYLDNLDVGRFNPLGVLNPEDDDLIDDVEVIAEMIVPFATGEDSHWNDRARSMIAGLLLHMTTSQPEENRTLFKLYEWLRLPPVDWIMIIQDMQRSEAFHGVIRSQGNEILSLMETSEKEFGSVISTARRYTDIFKSPALIRSLSASDFDVNRIAQEKMTIYLILPSDKLESHRTWLRLCIRMMLAAIMRNKGHRVTFLMDEFHSLGHMKIIEKAMGRLPGYNVTLWPILQDLNQLKSLYKDSWETFLANSRVRHFFGIGDNFTADYVSKRSGDTTVVTWNKSQDNTTYTPNKRPLMTPQEVTESPQMLTFIDNLPLALLDKAPYYTWQELVARAKPNPYL